MDVPSRRPSTGSLGTTAGGPSIEINGSMIPGDEPGSDLVVIFGRYIGDRELQDRDHGAAGRRVAAHGAVELIPEFGHWRHPSTTTRCSSPATKGVDARPDPTGPGVGRHGRSGSPWPGGSHRHRRSPPGLGDMALELRDAAAAAGLSECWAVPVPDPLTAARRDRRPGAGPGVGHGGAPLRPRLDDPDAGAGAPVAPPGHRAAPGGPPRSAHRPDQPHRVLGGAGIGAPRRSRPPGRRALRRTSTGSRRSTTSTATGWATSCSPRWASACRGPTTGRRGGPPRRRRVRHPVPHAARRRRRGDHRRAGGRRRWSDRSWSARHRGVHRRQRGHRQCGTGSTSTPTPSSMPPIGPCTGPRTRAGVAGTWSRCRLPDTHPRCGR